MNFVDYLFEGCAPEGRAAVIEEKGVVTYGELRERVRGVAWWLKTFGLGMGERCLILGENSGFWIESYLGVMLAGGVAVPVSTTLGGKEVGEIVASVGAKVAFVQGKFVGRVREVLGEGCLVVSEGGVEKNGAMICTLREGGELDDRRALAALMFTSGSTGRPRGVMVTHRNLMANTSSIVEYLGLSGEDRVLDVLPLSYCFGASLLHTHLRAGGSIVLENGFLYPDRALATLNRTECTGMAGVPATYQILLRKSSLKRMKFPTLRTVQQAGGKLGEGFLDELREALPGARVVVMYGQTEGTARLSYLPAEVSAAKRGSIGKGIPGVKLSVVDAHGNPVVSGEVGEIVAEGENVTAGYWQAPEETEAVYRNGRLHTGDLATVDKEGFIYVVGRAKEFLKLGGYRVGCQQIESVVLDFGGIAEAAVIGVPDELQGEAVVLFVAHPRGEAVVEELRAYCRERLPMQHRPREIVVVEALPKNAAGKVDRGELRKRMG